MEGEVKDHTALHKVTLAIERYLKEQEVAMQPDMPMEKKAYSPPAFKEQEAKSSEPASHAME